MQAIADDEAKAKKQKPITIEGWDYRYYAEKVRKAKYDLDERLLTQQQDDAPVASDQIVRRRYETVGPYRVRRHSPRGD